jgi:hypothetical protein
LLTGLHSLVLSHNPKITSDGWTKFGLALASGSCLRSLEIDYNDIGDIVATCIAIALPGVPLLETLDLECTGITDKTGQVRLTSCHMEIYTLIALPWAIFGYVLI